MKLQEYELQKENKYQRLLHPILCFTEVQAESWKDEFRNGLHNKQKWAFQTCLHRRCISDLIEMAWINDGIHVQLLVQSVVHTIILTMIQTCAAALMLDLDSVQKKQ